MPSQHARLSPSAAERWIRCPASIRMESEVPAQVESEYAQEGTCAHELAELKARLAFGDIPQALYEKQRGQWKRRWSILTDRVVFEMDAHTDAYVELIQERQRAYPHTQVMFEQRLFTGIPECWGTSDTVLVSPAHVEIIDFKYGAGVLVEALDNPQLKLYGLGALDTYGDMLGDTEMVYITVHQPRLGNILTCTITPLKLRQWREKLLPIAEEALGDNARFGPSESACRWCPASGRCRAQMEAVFDDDTDFKAEPKTLGAGELADFLAKITMIRDWCNAVESTAFERAYEQKEEIPGFKIVLGGGRRSITDEAGAIEHAVSLGYPRDAVSRIKLATLGDLESLMTPKGFATKMADFIRPPEPKPTLVPDSDKRPSINVNSEAVKVFDADEEDLL